MCSNEKGYSEKGEGKEETIKNWEKESSWENNQREEDAETWLFSKHPPWHAHAVTQRLLRKSLERAKRFLVCLPLDWWIASWNAGSRKHWPTQSKFPGTLLYLSHYLGLSSVVLEIAEEKTERYWVYNWPALCNDLAKYSWRCEGSIWEKEEESEEGRNRSDNSTAVAIGEGWVVRS
jgi:hypothetical protein